MQREAIFDRAFAIDFCYPRRYVVAFEISSAILIAYFVKRETKDKLCYTENEVILMLKFLIDNIFAVRSELFSTIHRKPYGSKLCPLITNLFLHPC